MVIPADLGFSCLHARRLAHTSKDMNTRDITPLQGVRVESAEGV
jgi:hypothetical protein